jgi:hypothetical protein
LVAAICANDTRPDGTSGAFNDKEAIVLSGVSNNQTYNYGYSVSVSKSEDASGSQGNNEKTLPKAAGKSNTQMTDAINQFNDMLDSPALKIFGEVLSKLGPIGELIHFIPDFFIGHLGTKVAEKFARMLGDTGEVKPSHFEKERSEGLY